MNLHRTLIGLALSMLASTALTGTAMAGNGNWNTTVEVTPRAHILGNPDAETTLAEFVSYTCPHCADFTIQGEAPLQYVFIGAGKLRLEIRPVIRNVVDLTATMLVQCGDSSKFLQNHTMFMTRQKVWLDVVRNSTRAQQAAWFGPNPLAARQALSQQLGFYDMMELRGYSRPEIDRCLADDARAAALEANTLADAAEFGIRGTPSFALNGSLLEGVHNWPSLETALQK